MQSKRLFAIGSAFAALLLSTQARAGQGSVTHSTTTYISSASPGSPSSEKFIVEPFDTKLGKLRGVIIEIDMKLAGRWTAENESPDERKMQLGGSARLSVAAFGRPELFAMSAADSRVATLAPGAGPLGTAIARKDELDRASHTFDGIGATTLKVDASAFWTKTASPGGVPFHVLLSSRVVQAPDLETSLRAGGIATVRVTYIYDSGSPHNAKQDVASVFIEDVVARREDALLA